MYVAVYGSLLSGLHNHPVLGNSKFIGEGVLTGYALYAVSSFFPGIVQELDSAVRVEVYECDDATMRRLDRLEGYIAEREEDSLYLRRTVRIPMINATAVQCQVYVWNGGAVAPAAKIASGDWRAALRENRRGRV